MNRDEHIVIGIVIFGVYYFGVYYFINNFLINSFVNPVIGISVNGIWYVGAILTLIGSVIPDYIEPATHWTHRGKFHSKRTLNLTLWIFLITAIIGLFSAPFFYISSFFLGYIFHLFADSTTPVGLPIN